MHIYLAMIMRLAITYHDTDDDGELSSECRYGSGVWAARLWDFKIP